jgi:general secretion pathway protein D
MNQPLPARASTGLALLFSAGLLAAGLAGCCTNPPAPAQKKTFSSFDSPTRRTAQVEYASGVINLQNADLEQVLALYQEISGRTVIRGTLPRPFISVRNQTPLTRVQALQLLDTVLAQNGIAMVLAGDTAVKAVPNAMAASESPPEIMLPREALPDSGSFMCRTVQVKKVRPSEVIPVLAPFAKSPNALLPIDAENQLIIRDYSSNVRRMLEMLQELEKGTKL